jgi:hypothetical protein
MNEFLMELARGINGSGVQSVIVNWLRTVPGLPPIVQTFHILGIGVVMGTIVMLNLRVLGWAVPSQSLSEMTRRLMPWLWSALAVSLLSGLMFVIARPRRYFVNPVFGIKFALLSVAIVLSVALPRLIARKAVPASILKAVAGVSMLVWIGVMLAGRWIAYADYLFPPE